jgi:ribosomal protein S18 acetylase RimI-like enzyme
MARDEDPDPKEPEKRNGRPSVYIREMDIDDLAAVFHLGEKLFTAEEVPNLYRTWDEYEVTGLFQTDPELCLVAEDENMGLVAGFALGTTIEKSRSAWKYGHLIWLGVRPGYQRFGVGERLFNQLRSRMEERGVRIMLVDTEADNLGALKFFRDQGFAGPQEHIYLSLNLETQKKKNGERHANGKSQAS